MCRQVAFFALLALAARAHAASSIVAVDLTGVIHPITVEILDHALAQAKEQKAAAVLVRLNTPGGMLDTARLMVEKIVTSPVPVLIFVTPSTARAASVGVLVLEAGDVAAMAPGTHTGSAQPLIIGNLDPALRKKLESDAAAALRAVVAKRGRNAALAEKAVLESRSFTDREALEGKLIDVVARNEEDLLSQLDGREILRFDGQRQVFSLAHPQIISYEKTVRQKLLASIADPNVALMLLALGGLAVYIEFTSPGLIFPGVAGAILLLLGFAALAVLPINWLGAALMLTALVLFVLEAEITSHGILGAGGAVAMTLGAMLLIDSPVPEMRVRFTVAAALSLPFAIITVFLLTLVIRARRGKVVTGSEGLVGEIGTTAGLLSPEGRVFVHGEYWDAVSPTPVPNGASVKVNAVDRLTLLVEPVSKRQGG